MKDAEMKSLLQEIVERTQEAAELSLGVLGQYEEYLENRAIDDNNPIEADTEIDTDDLLEYTPSDDPPFHLGPDVQKNWRSYRNRIVNGGIRLVCDTLEEEGKVRAALEIMRVFYDDKLWIEERLRWNKKLDETPSPDRATRELIASALMDACSKHFDAGHYDECKKELEAWLKIWSRDSYMVPSKPIRDACWSFLENLRAIEAPWRRRAAWGSRSN